MNEPKSEPHDPLISLATAVCREVGGHDQGPLGCRCYGAGTAAARAWIVANSDIIRSAIDGAKK